MTSDPNAIPSAPLHAAGRRLLIGAPAWSGILILCAALMGCPRFSVLYAVSVGITLAVVCGELLFLDAVLRRGKSSLIPAFKKFTGYAVVLQYAASSLPRVEWSNAGLISDGRAAFLYVLTLACTAAGMALFALMGGKGTLLAFGLITREEAADRTLRKKNREARRKSPWAMVLEWADSLAYAVILVLLVNIFVFQIYAVPSESMVPVFLTGDRPFTVKLLAGPKLPLTDYRLPFVKQPARGDVVTIANPRYPENARIHLKKYLSQMVYMITFTAVNLDKTSETGEIKADPLVKRIVGVPGEKLMMVDDVLYARTARDAGFHVVEADRDRYAQTDLWKLPAAQKKKVASFRVDEAARKVLEAWDRRKNAADPAVLAGRLHAGWTALSLLLDGIPEAVVERFVKTELPKADSAVVAFHGSLLADAAAEGVGILTRNGAGTEDVSLALAAAQSPAVKAALAAYLTAGAAAQGGPTAYERGSRVLNLLIKENLLARLERSVPLIAGGGSFRDVASDPARARLLQEASQAYVYLHRYYDTRNFGEFPSGEAFLGPDQYFAMGDNRYNSMDFRYGSQAGLRRLDPSDPASVRYESQLAPFPLERKYIESFAVVRIWPFTRLGLIR